MTDEELMAQMLTPADVNKPDFGQSIKDRIMSPYERLHSLISRVTYKPGWTFKLVAPTTFRDGENRYWGPYTLIVTQTAADVTRPNVKIQLSFTAYLDQDSAHNMPDDIFVENFVARTIRDFELHEMDEWFKLDGKCVREPKH